MEVTQWFEKRTSIAQTVWEGMQYSLISDDNKQCHPFVFCKEFVLDVIWSCLRQQPTDIYGFKYDPKTEPNTSLASVRVLLRNIYDDKFTDRVPKCLQFLNKLESQLGFPLSTVERCENAEDGGLRSAPPLPDKRGPIFLLNSPANWMHAPPLLSMLTLMIRIGMAYGGKGDIWKHAQKVTERTTQPYQKRDDEHLKRSWQCIQDLIANKCDRFLPERLDNWPLLKNRLEIHECGGIVSLATGQAKWVCPAWYKPKPQPEESPAEAAK